MIYDRDVYQLLQPRELECSERAGMVGEAREQCGTLPDLHGPEPCITDYIPLPSSRYR